MYVKYASMCVKHVGEHAHICLQTHKTSLEGLTVAPGWGTGCLGNMGRREIFHCITTFVPSEF